MDLDFYHLGNTLAPENSNRVPCADSLLQTEITEGRLGFEKWWNRQSIEGGLGSALWSHFTYCTKATLFLNYEIIIIRRNLAKGSRFEFSVVHLISKLFILCGLLSETLETFVSREHLSASVSHATGRVALTQVGCAQHGSSPTEWHYRSTSSALSGRFLSLN